MTAATDHDGVSTTFSYDPLGRRIAKRSGDATTSFGWDGDVLAFESTQSAFKRKEMAFYHCDHLGTPQELTDHEGSIAWSAQQLKDEAAMARAERMNRC